MNTRNVVIAFFLLTLGIPAHAQWVQTGLYVGNILSLAVIGTNTSSPTLFAGIEDDGVFRSTDNGTSWTRASGGLPLNTVQAFAVIGTNSSSPMLFAGIYGGEVYRSTDSGANWTGASNGLTNNVDVYSLAVIGTNSSSPMLFAGTDVGVFRSSDSGTSWTGASTGLPNTRIHALAVIGTNSSSPMLFAGTLGGGVFRSTDSGTSWTEASNDLTNTLVYSLAVIDINSSSPVLFAGTDVGIFRSTDSGTTWTGASTGLTDAIVIALAVSSTNLFAGLVDSGVWRRPLSDFNQSGVAEQAPVSKWELQSYPNPFSQSTDITFTSEAAGYADVSIVNLLGIEVTHLFSGELAAGEHSFVWNCTGALPCAPTDGMYECLVRMNGRVETLPVVLAR